MPAKKTCREWENGNSPNILQHIIDSELGGPSTLFTIERDINKNVLVYRATRSGKVEYHWCMMRDGGDDDGDDDVENDVENAYYEAPLLIERKLAYGLVYHASGEMSVVSAPASSFPCNGSEKQRVAGSYYID